ncbi:uncharacterized protein K452DRAFT_289596 [Aplosporella prunicola CBS 121167]|uniref:Uncharacterized protein n=1 Tax=Aplosporella prunicola CBS 121167 TaxID=1176127 RepID=A0A6A6B8J8_9PEZI|nr:uncharacterized protein K452DRAFT_289596 [Aplosporella prunicola CBS 121167]KAF2139595.1 hypothetical protein K452DRAFT_289596 [Aplosporella prunicola CBS 121167]
MSFDLLAEFGSGGQQPPPPTQQTPRPLPPQQQPQRQQQRFSFFDDLADLNPSSANAQAPAPAQANDDWGDFEDATPAATSKNTQPSDPWESLRAFASPSSASTPPVAKAPTPALNTAPPQNDLFDFGSWDPPQTQTPKPAVQQTPTPAPPRDPNVLFDAENLSVSEEEDDDFGDFEGGASTTALNIDSLIDELELSDPLSSLAPSSKKTDWKTNTVAKFAAQGRSAASPIKPAAVKTPPKPQVAKTPKPAPKPTPKPVHNPLDDWDDFTETTPASSASQPSALPIPQPRTISDPRPGELPPTNIPPPALLLTLFPPIFSAAQSSLFQPLSSQPQDIKNKILADTATFRFLHGYLAIGTVAARVIAGRKLRWKRDTFLAQGMRIAPAGRQGGMKLTSIDRSESTKEDREAADVVRAWREQVGRLRTVAASVNSQVGGLGHVPEMAETMAVRTAKESEGAVTALRQCALCGLKRNERVGKVDVEVEDSFGEWWMDQLSMHRACRNFWEEHKERLR